MNNYKMTYPMLKQIRFIILIILVSSFASVQSCSDSRETEIKNSSLDTTEQIVQLTAEESYHLKYIEPLPIDTVEFEMDNFECSAFNQNELDLLKADYQKQLDTGIDMIGTERNQYGHLIAIKNTYRNWLEENCIPTEEMRGYLIKIDKFEASTETWMRHERSELQEQFSEEDWGLDMDMIIYRAGIDQLHNYLGWLLAQSNEWCN